MHHLTRLLQRVVKQRLGLLHPIALRALPVRNCVHAHEIRRVDDDLAGASVGPDDPRVGVADRGGGERGADEGGADLCDVACDGGGVGAGARVVRHARGGDTVQVFAADGDADDEAGEVGAVRGDGGV